MDKIKGERAPRIRDLFRLDRETLADWLTIGASTWESPENPKESIESMKTAIQNSAFVGYHMVVTTLGAIEILNHLS